VFEIKKSIETLEVVARGLILKTKPDPKQLLDVTMRVLAEEERVESMLEKSKKGEERKEIRESLIKIREIKRTLLRIYFSSALLGTFKPEYAPAVSALGERKAWSQLQILK